MLLFSGIDVVCEYEIDSIKTNAKSNAITLTFIMAAPEIIGSEGI
jgi:hypothetical protein